MAKRSGAKAVQAAINALGSIALTVDGVIGSRSLYALSQLPNSAREFVNTVATGLKVPLPKFVARSDARQIVARVSRDTSVPEEYLLLALEHENPSNAMGYFVEYEGKFRGLGQFDRATWNAVMSHSFDRVTDDYLSILAIANLYLANKRTYRNQFGTVQGYSKHVGYLYHNQGAGAAEHFLRTGKVRYPKQSGAALRTFSLARGQFNENNQSRAIA